MDPVLLLACSLCATGHPIYLALSMVAGTVPVAYLLLRPYTQEIQTWGVPRMDAARLISLVMMLACLVPVWFIGRQEHSKVFVAVCLAGLAACCFYLWFRSCWLLDMHAVTMPGRALIFPGLLAPAMLVLGTDVGNWLLGMLLFVPTWPGTLVPHTIANAVIGLPIWCLVQVGLRQVFPKPDGTASPQKRHAATPEIPALVEQSD